MADAPPFFHGLALTKRPCPMVAFKVASYSMEKAVPALPTKLRGYCHLKDVASVGKFALPRIASTILWLENS